MYTCECMWRLQDNLRYHFLYGRSIYFYLGDRVSLQLRTHLVEKRSITRGVSVSIYFHLLCNGNTQFLFVFLVCFFCSFTVFNLGCVEPTHYALLASTLLSYELCLHTQLNCLLTFSGALSSPQISKGLIGITQSLKSVCLLFR